MRGREADQREVFRRPKTEVEKEIGDTKEVYFEANIFDLINAFSKALKEVPKEMFYEVIKDEFTVEGKVHELLHRFMDMPRIKLSLLFSQARSKLEIIATFLAVLELIRLKEVLVVQRNVFGDIEVFRNKEKIQAKAS